MIEKLFNGFKDIMIETVDKLKGSDKRITLAKLAKAHGDGGQTAVAETFQVGRDTIRKGSYELESGFSITDAFQARGRKKVEEQHLPHLLEDIQAIVDGQSQTDPSFNTTQLYTRMTTQEVRDQLVLQKGYQDAALPTNQTINTKLHQLGYHLKKVQKTKPVKQIEETDAIFETLHTTHEAYQGESNVVRLSFDTKNKVKIGPFSRGGKSRLRVEAADHDFGQTFLSPFGILDMTNEHVELTFTASKVTADFIADQIEAYVHKLCSQQKVDTLIINADNGPENNSRRTQFMKRMIEFAATYDIKVILAYYPPYHSKYNPIERVWAVLEQHWNGVLLNTQEMVLGFAESMTWKGKHPSVTLEENSYETGVKVEKKVMDQYEKMIDRAKGIGKWFVEIHPHQCKKALYMGLKTQ